LIIENQPGLAFKLPITKLPNCEIALPIFAPLAQKQAGIYLRSSQNYNSVLFSVLTSASDGETNLLTYKHLQEIYRFPQAALWKSAVRAGQSPRAD
jgi:hypothetical protein